jgi:hypothetical protein
MGVRLNLTGEQAFDISRKMRQIVERGGSTFLFDGGIK